ncbi:hypothetical protein ABN028_19685 [Actinopolymorpha sp. B17G11]|uniref:hypothetical protein n=1 Tax=Actinopolymorpha sp. B17G11 TaxID=3160861 RepID=UPI0032E52470
MNDYPEIAERFARETAKHEMTVLHDDGLYRHLRFADPANMFYGFDLITLPGTLIARFSGEAYVFSREPDMFEFFRHQRGYTADINPGYWAQKLSGGHDSAMRYDHEIFERKVKEYVADDIRCGNAPRGISRVIKEFLAEAPSTWEGGAREALEGFAYYVDEDDRYDYNKQPDYMFHDTWEWNLRDYHWAFLWTCHAIVWGIAKYDEAKAAASTPEKFTEADRLQRDLDDALAAEIELLGKVAAARKLAEVLFHRDAPGDDDIATSLTAVLDGKVTIAEIGAHLDRMRARERATA